MVRHAGDVESTAAIKTIAEATVRRNQLIDPAQTGGIAVVAAEEWLPSTVGVTLARGRFLDAATSRYPAVVLGVGIANVMVISVLERRSEIGLRRALGATRRHVGAQFLCESLLLAAAGGLAGTLLGALVTTGYAASQGWQAVVPPLAIGGGMLAAIGIGALSGLYPVASAPSSPPITRAGPPEGRRRATPRTRRRHR